MPSFDPLEMGRPPRLLLVSSVFPPERTAGAPRTWSMASFLRRMGWEVTVLTSDPRQIVRTDRAGEVAGEITASGIRRIDVSNRWAFLNVDRLKAPLPIVLRRAARKLALIAGVDFDIGYASSMVRAARQFRPEDVDVVLVSTPPACLIPAADRIARRLGRPLVIDYRDLWTLNPFGRRKPPLRDQRMESDILGRTKRIVSVTPQSAKALAERFGCGDRITVITNGFDSDLLRNVSPAGFGHFAIVYTGSFYPQRTISPLLEALSLLHRRRVIDRPWRFHHFGPQSELVRHEAAMARLESSRVECHGPVPRAEALAAVAGADLAVVVAGVSSDPASPLRAVLPGKVYEAIGLNAQILGIAPPGSDLEAVIRVAGRGRVFVASETEAIADFVAAVARGEVVEAGDRREFDWRTLAPRLSDVLVDAIRVWREEGRR